MFTKLPAFRLIFSLVLSTHIGFFLFFAWQQEPPPPLLLTTRSALVIRTVVEEEKQEIVVEKGVVEEEKKEPTPPQKPISQTKKETPPKKKSSSSPTHTAALLAEAQKNLNEVKEGPRSTTKTEKKSPPPVTASDGESIEAYASILVLQIQEQFVLPEYGEVKISLTLEKSGKVKALVIKESRSEKNSAYLKEKLNQFQFIPFYGTLKEAKEHTFIITLKNS